MKTADTQIHALTVVILDIVKKQDARIVAMVKKDQTMKKTMKKWK